MPNARTRGSCLAARWLVALSTAVAGPALAQQAPACDPDAVHRALLQARVPDIVGCRYVDIATAMKRGELRVVTRAGAEPQPTDVIGSQDRRPGSDITNPRVLQVTTASTQNKPPPGAVPGIPAAARLHVELQPGSGSAPKAGQPMTWRLLVGNVSRSTVSHVDVGLDALSSNVSIDQVTGACGRLPCTLEVVPAGATEAIELTGHAVSPRLFVLAVAARGVQPDSTMTEDRAIVRGVAQPAPAKPTTKPAPPPSDAPPVDDVPARTKPFAATPSPDPARRPGWRRGPIVLVAVLLAALAAVGHALHRARVRRRWRNVLDIEPTLERDPSPPAMTLSPALPPLRIEVTLERGDPMSSPPPGVQPQEESA